MTAPQSPTLQDITQGQWLLGQSNTGMTRSQAAEMAGGFSRWASALLAAGASPDQPVVAWRVPGRIELFGKHTDYCGGRSLLAATECAMWVLAVPRGDETLRVRSTATGDEAEFKLHGDLEIPRQGWRNYAMTAARRLARNFGGTPGGAAELRGAEIAFDSSLPAAAGLSSSSALLISAFLAIADINQLQRLPLWQQNIRDRTDLATYLATVENGRSFGPLLGDRGVGTFGGSEDHVAILCCRQGQLSQYAFAPTVHEDDIEWPDDLLIAVAASGVIAEKTGDRLADYNRLAEQHRRMVEFFNETRGTDCPNLRCCLDAVAGDGSPLQHIFAHLVSFERSLADWDFPGRAMQFAEEHGQIVPDAAAAIAEGDWMRLGRLADRSHELADFCLRNQTPQTNGLQQLARRLGALATSAFGAGFGGSVWAIIRQRQAEPFLTNWQTAYTRAFRADAARASFFVTRPAAAAARINLRG